MKREILPFLSKPAKPVLWREGSSNSKDCSSYLAASVWAAPWSVLHTMINLILTVVAIEIEDQTHFTDEKDEFQTE